jgi:hypothetical protein
MERVIKSAAQAPIRSAFSQVRRRNPVSIDSTLQLTSPRSAAMKRVGLMLSLSLLLAGTWSAPGEAAASAEVAVVAPAPPVPTRRVNEYPNALLSALKQNDFAGFLQAMQSDKDASIAALAQHWDDNAERLRAAKLERSAERDKAGGEAPEALADDDWELAWQKLQTDSGVDLLVSELQPKLAEAASKHQMEFNIGFGAALAGIASDKDFNAEQVQQITQLMYAVQNWSARVDFADPERLRTALQAAARLVRQTGLKRFEDVQTLAFEDAVVHGDTLMRTIKQALAAYDVDADEILNSVRLSEVDAVADRATLHAEARVFGVFIAHDFRQQFFEGEWMDADAVASITQWRARQAEVDAAAHDDAAQEAEVPAEVTAPAESCSPENEFKDVAIETEVAE